MKATVHRFFLHCIFGIISALLLVGSTSAQSITAETTESNHEEQAPIYRKYPSTVATSTIKFQLCTKDAVEGLPTDSNIPYEIVFKNLRNGTSTTIVHLLYAPLYKANTCTPFTIHRDQLLLEGRGKQSVEISVDNDVIVPYFGSISPVTAEFETTKDTDELKADAVDFMINKVIQKEEGLFFEICNVGGKEAVRTTFSFKASPITEPGTLPSPTFFVDNPVWGTTQSKLDSDVCKSVELLFDAIPDYVISNGENHGVLLSFTTEPKISEYNAVNNQYAFMFNSYSRDLTDYYAQEKSDAINNTPVDTNSGEIEAGAGEAASMIRFANAANPFEPPAIVTPNPESIVSWMFEHKLTKFASIDEFGYDRPVTRGEITKFFVQYAQLLNLERNETKACAFTDIADYDQTLTPFIIQACQYSLMKGFEGQFMPDNLLEGTEGITVLIRALDGFLDESQTPRRQAYFDAAQAKNIIGSGYTPITIEQPLSRGEIGLWLYRAHRYFEALEVYGPVIDIDEEPVQIIPDVSELENPEDIVDIIGEV